MKIGWGIDVGVASLGFAVIELDARGNPNKLLDGISIVYPAPTGAAERTRYKSARTQTARHKQRMKLLRAESIKLFGLKPDFDSPEAWPDLLDGVMENGNPRRNNSRVRLRAHGLSASLSSGDLARSILHIAKNRGQRLTRGLKDEARGDVGEQKKTAKERQSMANTANETKGALQVLGRELGIDGAAHPSQLLMNKAGDLGGTRLKKDREDMPVFTRAMMEAELEALLEAQRPYHAAMTEEMCKELKEIVFREADPKPPQIGKCRYGVKDKEGEIETRLPRGSDLFQRKRIYEEVNNLRLISSRTAKERSLSLTERNILTAILLNGRDLTAAGVRTSLGLKKDALADKTSLDISDTRKGRKTSGTLQCHPLAAAMAKADALEQWHGFTPEQREQIANLVRTEDDVEALRTAMNEFSLSEGAIGALCDARLPATYSAAGQTATHLLLDELKQDVVSNYEAEQRAGLESWDAEPPELDRLPYYGQILQGSCTGGNGELSGSLEERFGRIPNPVVHVGLNQLRKVANAYLDIYGKPERICIELARDLNKSAEDREEAEKQAAKNRIRNERYIKTLGAHKRKLTHNDLTRMKLHEMQDGECLYTGKPISMEHLFDGSVEIEHILPKADTRDDGIANLALAFKEANGYKAKRPPFDAFGQGYLGQDYANILKRAWKRGRGVHWRFKEDAMDRFTDQDSFTARFLNDTRYVAKMAAKYLATVCADKNGIISLNGRITSDLRREWGLGTVIRDLMVADGRLSKGDVKRNEGGETVEELKARRDRFNKIRWDHRHHLLDAIVAACVTRSDVQRLQTLAAQETEYKSAREVLSEIRRADPDFKNAGICWQDGFRTTVEAFLRGRGRGEGTDKPPVTAVAPKADHATTGQLHKETNYGVICAVPGQPGQYITRSHVSLLELTRENIEKIGVPTTALAAVGDAMAAGDPIWWGGADPLTALRDNLAPELDAMRGTLMSLMESAPETIFEDVRSDSGKDKVRAQWAVKEYIRQTGRRRYTKIELWSLRILKGPADHRSKPKRANRTGGNDRMVYFINAEGERDVEIVSTLDANAPGYKERWRREDGRALFTLRKNDLVEMAMDPKVPASLRGIYRVVSFSPTKTAFDAEFLPVEESRAPKEVPDKTRKRIRSLKSFREHAPVMILCDSTGRVRWRSPSMN